ncbi:hypothetical protein JX265_010796 [Neoarthrinium moseri]|uniref:Uncharacterized protein n=1 Tax=Neoarthrinium moseri TaxID=1658444 RepID=A0A9P9WDD0_9PEZI|nr:uncharacterized protein JN550_010638 [Neoarthrinium moseri]KAI1840209.1 hypothetical protein JX266_013576 [Neoarthrinium moseri]KAI1858128.1 hypothetical protein JX265_010796 [Neoarthrinium moseri]KAI1862007.1 hypothetical protein JN550_010638 [Neoarthrinium moseri]
MSHLSPLESGLRRTYSATSVAASATTYHSFYEVDAYQPVSKDCPVRVSSPKWKEDVFQPAAMKRHDSGYGSIPSGSNSGGSQTSGRRTSTTSGGSSQTRPYSRPSIRRAARSTPSPRSSLASSHQAQRPRSQQQSYSYFHFPSLEVSLGTDEVAQSPEPIHPPPPQTTHYWTSDHTRKLEYAAIDAASRGIRGWILKHVVPDCFVPKQNRRLAFDDDTGSVRRYRLELECDDSTKRCRKGKTMGWAIGRS